MLSVFVSPKDFRKTRMRGNYAKEKKSSRLVMAMQNVNFVLFIVILLGHNGGPAGSIRLMKKSNLAVRWTLNKNKSKSGSVLKASANVKRTEGFYIKKVTIKRGDIINENSFKASGVSSFSFFLFSCVAACTTFSGTLANRSTSIGMNARSGCKVLCTLSYGF